MAKPFVKWAGGKGKLITCLENALPFDFNFQPDVTYIEPFGGGGAMLFHMLSEHPNIQRAIINDINPTLIHCYRLIQQDCGVLIRELRMIENEYNKQETFEDKKAFYYKLRVKYNSTKVSNRNTPHTAALFMFFNKTCFNGLYRENHHGDFNVPFGKYVHPTICNEKVLNDAHDALQRVEILQGNYKNVIDHIDWREYNFFYFDPPYRPLWGANNFKEYTYNSFGDPEQEDLKRFCDVINDHHGLFMLSNSDSESEPGVSYFGHLYAGYNVQKIWAPRNINAYAYPKKGTTEILIRNY